MNSKTKTIKQEKEKNVQVFVRVRPINNSEKAARSCVVVNCNGTKEIVVKERPVEKLTKTFTFDKVFGPESKQLDVYKTVVHPLIEEVLAGYNCTVFAYGQTGTGKTFTMEGEKSNEPNISWEEDPLSGIIPRSLSQLFDELRLLQAEYTVRVSFLELYNEEIFDLLSPPDDTTKLRLFEDTARKGSVIIQGLEEVTVHNKQEVYKILEKGSLKRTTAATLMNAQSSRSHTVFSITVHIKDNSVDGEELLKTGKLNLVDLAGSENISRSGAVDKRAREAGNINQSLLTLGRCITSLVEHCPHIPYRESKLTRLLQESLGGRTKTSIIATVSPAVINLEETLSTLDYAHRARNITNKPEINQKLTKRALLKEYTEEIERLRRDLEATREKHGVYVAHENYTDMLNQIEQQGEEIINKVATIKAIKEEMEKKEELLNKLDIKLSKAKDMIQKTIGEREERNYLIEKYMEKEEKLTEQARQLRMVVSESTRDADKLHQKLEIKTKIDESNLKACEKFFQTFQKKNLNLSSLVDDFREDTNFFLEQRESLSTNCKLQSDYLDCVLHSVSSFTEILQKFDNIVSAVQTKNQHTRDSNTQCHENANSFIDSLQTNLTSLRNAFENNFKNHLNQVLALQGTQTQFEEKLKTSTGILEELTNKSIDLKRHFEETQSILNKTVISLIAEYDEIKGIEQSLQDDREKKDEELKATANKLLAIIAQDTSKPKREALLAKMDKVTTDTGEISNVSQAVCNLMVKHEDTNNQLLSLGETLKSDLEKNSALFAKDIQRCRNKETNAKEALNVALDEQQSFLNSRRNEQDAFFQEQNRLFEQFDGEFELTTTDMKEEFHSQIRATKVNVEQCLVKCSDFRDEKCEQLNLQYDRVTKQTDNFAKGISEQADLVNTYVNNDIQQYVPTGQTPGKRNWLHPQPVECLSPHERLIQRFWKERALAVRDNFETEYDAINTSSEKCSEDDEKTSEEEESSQGSSPDASVNNVRKCASTGDILSRLDNTMNNSNSSVLSDCVIATKLKPKNKKKVQKENRTRSEIIFKKPSLK